MRLQEIFERRDDPCWKGYRQLGMKKKNGKDVPNCIPEEEVDEELSPNDDVSDWVDDFQDSNAPQFRGKGAKKRAEMATAAWHAAQRKR